MSGPSSTEQPSLVGQTLDGRYEVLEEIGRGGMGVIYRARHLQLGRQVAIKLLGAAEGKALARFEREARAAAKLAHPNIVKVIDFGKTTGGAAYFVMELLDGRDLRRVIAAEGALDVRRALVIAQQTLAALSAAHAEGIVHRDLKAHNIFLARRPDEGDDGVDFVVKLVDFGISKLLVSVDGEDQATLTTTGVLMGTPAYLSPEQAHGQRNIDARADIYSLGVVLYEMLTGELPFRGSTLEVMIKHANEPPRPPRLVRPDLDIPPEVERIVLRALRKLPEERFSSAARMFAAIDDALATLGTTDAAGVRSTTDFSTSASPRSWPVVVGVLLAASALALLTLYSDEHAPAPDAGAVVAVPHPDAPAPLDASNTASDALGPDITADLAERFTLSVHASPPSARIYVDGKHIGSGAVEQATRGSIRLRVTAPGYRSWRRELHIDTHRTLHVTLQKKRPPPADLEKNPYKPQ